MDFTHVTLGPDDEGRRIDKVLRRFLSEESLSSLYKSLRKGLIKIDGKKCEGSFRVHEGSEIQIASFLIKTESDSTKPAKHIPALDESSLIFKNDFLAFINKPYDIPVQPSSHSSISLTEIVQNDYERTHTESRSLSFRTGALHRLDRKTTGIIAFSQNLTGAQWFSAQIQAHELEKNYLAVIEGHLGTAEEWADDIAKDTRQNGTAFHTVSVNSPGGKRSLSTAIPLAYGTVSERGAHLPLTLARFSIKTGRTHQIRSQSAHHGYPLFGDTAYGGTKIAGAHARQDFFLHAYELRFPCDNPLSLPESLLAPLPRPFVQFVEEYFSKTLINCESLLII